MILRLIEEGIAAGIGTIAFALMFHVPKQYYLCGGCGGSGRLACLPGSRAQREFPHGSGLCRSFHGSFSVEDFCRPEKNAP